MADTGFIFPGTALGSRDGGDNNWINFDNVKADDAVLCTVELGPIVGAGFSRQLYVSNFGFSALVPAGATIDGIEVQFGDYDLTGDLVLEAWVDVRLVLADNSDGTANKITEIALPTSTLNTDQAGGASDLWSETITRADVIDADWGWLIKADHQSGDGFVRVDFMQMKVFFTAAAAGRIMSSLAYSGGLAHKGGIAGQGGGLAK